MFYEKENKPFEDKNLEFVADLLIRMNDRNFLKNSNVCLLEYIDKLGSITKAAKKMKISYKTAWDAINGINNVTDKPIVESISGGQDGGGTKLTSHGRKMIEVYRVIEEEQKRFIENLKLKTDNFDETFQIVKRMFIRASVRNQIFAEVVQINQSQVCVEIDLKVYNENNLTAIISKQSLQDTDIHVGSIVYALVKALHVTVLTKSEISDDKNIFPVTIKSLISDANKTEMELVHAANNILVSIGSNEIAKKNNFKVGDKVYAYINPSNIILGVT